MLTITCGPTFPLEPGAMLVAFAKRRVIRRTLAELGKILNQSLAYDAVLQWGDRNGRLHAHVLIDGLGRLPKSCLSSLQAWCKANRTGAVDYKYKPTEEALGYAVRYVTSWSKGVPQSLIDAFGRSPRLLRPSAGYWACEGEPQPKNPEGRERPVRVRIGEDGLPVFGERAKARPVSLRLRACGSSTVLVRREVGADGVGRSRFLGTLPVPFSRIEAEARRRYGDMRLLQFWLLSADHGEDRNRNPFIDNGDGSYRLRCVDVPTWADVGELLRGIMPAPTAGPAAEAAGGGPAGPAVSLDSLTISDSGGRATG